MPTDAFATFFRWPLVNVKLILKRIGEPPYHTINHPGNRQKA